MLQTLRDGMIETRGGNFDFWMSDRTQGDAAVTLAAVTTPVLMKDVSSPSQLPAPILGGRHELYEPDCYVYNRPWFVNPECPANTVLAVTSGWAKEGYEAVWAKNPFTVIPQLEQVQGSPLFSLTIVGHLYTRTKNPWKRMGSITNLL
jgi:hypothetical protein